MKKLQYKWINNWRGTLELFKNFDFLNSAKVSFSKGIDVGLFILSSTAIEIQLFYINHSIQLTIIILNFGFSLNYNIGFTGNDILDNELMQRKKEYREKLEEKFGK